MSVQKHLDVIYTADPSQPAYAYWVLGLDEAGFVWRARRPVGGEVPGQIIRDI